MHLRKMKTYLNRQLFTLISLWLITWSAAFAQSTITASSTSGGSISPSGDVPVVMGANQSFSLTAAPGYDIGSVTTNGVPLGPLTSFTFPNVTASQAIQASFAHRDLSDNFSGSYTVQWVDVSLNSGFGTWASGAPNNVLTNSAGIYGIDTKIQTQNSFGADRVVSMKVQTIQDGGDYNVAYIYPKGSGGIYFLLHTSGYLEVDINGYRYSPDINTGLDPHLWHTFQTVCNGSNIKIYIDGTLYFDKTDSNTAQVASNTGPVLIEATHSLIQVTNVAISSFQHDSVYTAGEFVWVDDILPQGATPASTGGDAWTWISASPAPYVGAFAHQSNLAAGQHDHSFTSATQHMPINIGDTLFAYVYMDPANPPSELMLQWWDGQSADWSRAYWGANNINLGVDGSTSRKYVGPLPLAGQWVVLAVPASQLGLEGSSVNAMAFTLYGGRATWDKAGKTRNALRNPIITVTAGSNGSISPGSLTLNPGATQTFSITPTSGYDIASVTTNGVSITPVPNSVTFSNVNNNQTLAATFGKRPIITISTDGNGYVSVNGTIVTGSTTIAYGSNLTLGIIPNSGYNVRNVVVNGTSYGSQTTLTTSNVTSDLTVSATFYPNQFTWSSVGIPAGSMQVTQWGVNNLLTSNSGSDESLNVLWGPGAGIADSANYNQPAATAPYLKFKVDAIQPGTSYSVALHGDDGYYYPAVVNSTSTGTFTFDIRELPNADQNLNLISGANAHVYASNASATFNPRNFTLEVRVTGGSVNLQYIALETGFDVEEWAYRYGGMGSSDFWLRGDFNGDGLCDIMRVFDGAIVGQNGMAGFDGYITQPGGFTQPSGYTKDQMISINRWGSNQGFGGAQVFLAGDFDGDGKCDVVRVFDWNGSEAGMDVSLSQGSYFANANRWAGGPPYYNPSFQLTGSQTFQFTGPQYFVVGDFNNDGKDDIARIYGDANGIAHVQVMLSGKNPDGSGRFNPPINWDIGTGEPFTAAQIWIAADINGDGCCDIARVFQDANNTASIDVSLSNRNQSSLAGLGFKSWSFRTTNWNPADAWVARDFNGQLNQTSDGKYHKVMHLMHFFGSSADFYRSVPQSNTFVIERWINNFFSYAPGSLWLGGDFTGDGSDDAANIQNVGNGPVINILRSNYNNPLPGAPTNP